MDFVSKTLVAAKVTAPAAASVVSGGLGAFLGAHSDKGWEFWAAVSVTSLVSVAVASLAYVLIAETRMSPDEARKEKRVVIGSYLFLSLVSFVATMWLDDPKLIGAIAIGLCVGAAGPAVVASVLADQVRAVGERVAEVLKTIFVGRPK